MKRKKSRSYKNAAREFQHDLQIIEAFNTITWHKNFWQYVGVVSVGFNIGFVIVLFVNLESFLTWLKIF